MLSGTTSFSELWARLTTSSTDQSVSQLQSTASGLHVERRRKRFTLNRAVPAKTRTYPQFLFKTLWTTSANPHQVLDGTLQSRAVSATVSRRQHRWETAPHRTPSLRRSDSGNPRSTINAQITLIVPITYNAGVVLPVRSRTRPTMIGLTIPPS